MDELYSVYYRGTVVGEVSVSDAGLYYAFFGKLGLEKEKFWRIIACSEAREIDLGICLFENPCYVLKKKLPKNRFDDRKWHFKAVCPQDEKRLTVPVVENQPFEDLDKIETGVFKSDTEESAIIFNTDH